MNKLLLQELEKASEGDEVNLIALEKARKLIAEKVAINDEFSEAIMSEAILTSVSEIAISYVKRGNFKSMTSQGWENLMLGDSISRGIINLEDNAAVKFFTQVVMMITSAILEGG